jgi:hypothetical protein
MDGLLHVFRIFGIVLSNVGSPRLDINHTIGFYGMLASG